LKPVRQNFYADLFCEDELNVAETFSDLPRFAGSFIFLDEFIHDIQFLITGVELKRLIFIF
jgi:hypothetical protein